MTTCPNCGGPLDELHMFSLELGNQRVFRCPDPACGMPDSAPPPSLAEQKAAQAARAQQPEGWADRVYLSVSGLRWRCCGNLFEDEHSPWCQQGPPLARGFF
jgi:hypothetical protein